MIVMLDSSKASVLPESPGIYFFSGGGRLLYIGKAVNIRRRVQQHLSVASYIDPPEDIMDMVSKAKKLKPPVIDQMDLPTIQAIRDFFHFVTSRQMIDMFFERVDDVAFREIGAGEEELLKEERRLILEMKPPMNSDTLSEEYASFRSDIKNIIRALTYSKPMTDNLRDKMNMTLVR